MCQIKFVVFILLHPVPGISDLIFPYIMFFSFTAVLRPFKITSTIQWRFGCVGILRPFDTF